MSDDRDDLIEWEEWACQLLDARNQLSGVPSDAGTDRDEVLRTRVAGLIKAYPIGFHDLKTWPAPFLDIASGLKTFEYRKDDRGFEVGNTLHLREYVPERDERKQGGNWVAGYYTGAHCYRVVTHILRGPGFGIPEGYCIMSIVGSGSLGATPHAVR